MFIPVGDVDWIAASGDYVTLHCGTRTYLASVRLSKLVRTLDPAVFVRTHRSAVVRLDRIRELRLRTHGDCDLFLSGGQRVRLSRTFRDAVERALGGEDAAGPPVSRT